MQSSHSVRVPSMSGSGSSAGAAQPPFVINLNAVEMDGVGSGGLPPPQQGPSSTAGNRPPSPPPQEDNVGMGVTSALPSLRALIKPLEGSLPFVLIILTKTLCDHRLGTSYDYLPS